MNINNVVVCGRTTRDVELKTLQSGIAIANLSIATNRVFKDRDGATQEEVEYHNVVVFGPTAENVAKFVQKGQIVSVVGRLKTNSWEKDGVKQYRTEILADNVQFGPKNGVAGTTEAHTAPVAEITEDEIPF